MSENKQQIILIRFGELGLKGKNKMKFIRNLANNIGHALRGLPDTKVSMDWGRLWVHTACPNEVYPRLKNVFGIYSFSPVVEVEPTIEAMAQAAEQVLLRTLPNGGTFKVETKRADKKFPMPSPQISREVAGIIFDRLGDDIYDADMHNPQAELRLEVREEAAYVYGEVIEGAKGMPVGSGGKALLMLSGGIDSPVAGWYALRRGVAIEAIHFHSFPFTGEQAKQKVLDLAKILSHWQGQPIKVNIVHFTEIQKAIYANCDESYGITLMRRMMFRLAEAIANKNRLTAIYTGESVGQVASQTLESMSVINDVTNMPILRPLIGFDKADIVKVAQEIETFETSILPYEDCCTVFLPPHPVIKPKLHEALEMEKTLDIEELLAEALAKTEVVRIS